jgi:hypothetical protein
MGTPTIQGNKPNLQKSAGQTKKIFSILYLKSVIMLNFLIFAPCFIKNFDANVSFYSWKESKHF